MKVKVGDQVKILVGKDKGKEGKVIKTLRGIDKILIEGLNIVKKHSKPNNTNDKGGIFDVEAPIHVSNVKVIAKTTKPVKTEKVEKVNKTEKVVTKAEKPVKAVKKPATKKKVEKAS